MKRIFIALMTTAAICVGLSSCQKSDESATASLKGTSWIGSFTENDGGHKYVTTFDFRFITDKDLYVQGEEKVDGKVSDNYTFMGTYLYIPPVVYYKLDNEGDIRSFDGTILNDNMMRTQLDGDTLTLTKQ